MIFGWLVCTIKGKHRRGKLDDKSDDGTVARYRCPRCGSTWTRKVRHASAQ